MLVPLTAAQLPRCNHALVHSPFLLLLPRLPCPSSTPSPPLQAQHHGGRAGLHPQPLGWDQLRGQGLCALPAAPRPRAAPHRAAGAAAPLAAGAGAGQRGWAAAARVGGWAADCGGSCKFVLHCQQQGYLGCADVAPTASGSPPLLPRLLSCCRAPARASAARGAPWRWASCSASSATARAPPSSAACST
jgi:hypothetical protein